MDILPALVTILADVLVIDPAFALPASDLRADLGMDSLDSIELGTVIDDEFNVELTDDEFAALTTVQSLADLITAKRPAKV